MNRIITLLVACLVILALPADAGHDSACKGDVPRAKPALDPDLTAYNISDRFVAFLRDAGELEVHSRQKVTYTESEGDEQTKRTVVKVEVDASMTPDSFRAAITKSKTPQPELILTLADGMITESHWFPDFGYRKQTYPASERMDGTGTAELRREPSLFAELGTFTCATGEFTGTWVGGSYVGEGMALRESAERLPDQKFLGEKHYHIKSEGYRVQDDGYLLTRDDWYWFDEEFRYVGRRTVYGQVPDESGVHNRSFHQVVEVEYVYKSVRQKSQ